ncbi:MAG: response regulator [Desulfobacterales bacterium]|jgi:twitching motility two-component system response regulator PilH
MNKMKVLVVDDSPTDLKLMSQPFLKQGYELVTATDGEEALKKAESEQPDLMVLDVIMPKINGFKVCRQIKTSAELKNIKIILLTSKNQDSDKFWGEKQGADAYITKPFDGQDLLSTAAGLF